MAAFFIDFDGTVFEFGTDNPLPDAIEAISHLLNLGHQVIFTTARTDASSAKRVLDRYNLGDCVILTSVQNPRAVVNDMGAVAINVEPDEGLADLINVGDELPLQTVRHLHPRLHRKTNLRLI